ncbi:GDSL-type esterase/lipase family protein [Rathayibacter sp. SD072]|uniref:SGNH/GDSL hydrolase family protein n=1 Tax=Rathayibacter sp. SD072 TaxID=2781731 RepID=UPI001A9699C3|nr:GDSL-type esterase/lipase family protein [Rathayibacter sp. SD072]MBO0985641.1 SGNH/GDSL hydrolase family protein [Rathayibacter sp. SD072]
MTRSLRPLRLVAAVAVAAALLAGCTSSPAPEESSGPAPAGALPFEAGTIVAMGDSMTAAVAACGQNKPCPSASWATGEDESVDSIARRAGEAVGAVPTIENVAAKGATSAEMPRQAEKAVAADPDLVLFLIGANDVCRKRSSEITTPEAFRAAVDTSLATLASGAPEATVFVSSIPDLLSFFEVERTNPEAVERWSGSSNCNSLLYEPANDDAESVARRANVDTTIDAYNTALSEACAAVANCVYDGGALHDFDVTPEDLSDVDHFHPSLAGQGRIADTAWTALLANAG